MADETTTPGPIVSVVAGDSDLRALVNSLRDQLADSRALIAQNNEQIANDRARSLQAQTDDEKQAYKEQIAALQAKSAAVRTSMAETQAEVQRLARNVPKIPLKVEVEGLGEAFSTIREELGVLLGPLNGITGRITSIVSLFRTLSKASRESGEAGGEGLKQTAQAAEESVNAVSKLTSEYTKISGAVKVSESALGATNKQLNLFANEVSGPIGQQLSLFSSEIEKGTAGELELGAAAGTAATETAALGEGFGAIILPLTIFATAAAVVVGALFEAGKSTAELGEKFEKLGLRVGVEANQMQALSHAAASVGVPLEALISGMTRLSFQLTGSGGRGVTDGTTRTRQQVELLIGSIQDASGKIIPTIDILEKLADTFQKLPNGAEKTGLAAALFGREIGAQLIPFLNKGRDGITGLIDEFQKLGVNLDGQPAKMESYNTAVEKVSTAWDRLKASFANVGVFTAVTSALEGASKRMQELSGFIDSISSRWDKFTAQVNKVSPQGAPSGRLYNFSTGPGAVTGQQPTPSLEKAGEQAKGAESAVKGAEDVLTRDQLITSGALASLDEYNKKVTTVLQEVNKANEQFGTLGGPGTQLKGRTQDIEGMRKELTALIGQMQSADAVAKSTINRPPGAGPAEAGPIVSVTKNLPQLEANLERIKELSSQLASAERQAAEETARLEKEQQNLATEFEKTGRAAEQEAAKQLAPVTQIKLYADEVAKLTQQQNGYVAALEKAVPQSLLQAAGVKSATDAQRELAQATAAVRAEEQRYNDEKAANAAQQIALRAQLATRGGQNPEADRANAAQLATLQDQQRQSDEAHKQTTDSLNQSLFNAVKYYDQTIQAISRLLPADANIQVIEKDLKETTDQLTHANGQLAESNKASAAETERDTAAKVALLQQSQRLTEEQQKLDQELTTQGEKQLTLRDRVRAAQTAFAEQSQVLADARTKLVSLEAGTQGYIDQQQVIAGATRKEIDAMRELNDAQKELNKNTLDLKKVMTDFNEVLEGVGVTLPKPLTKIVQMIDAMEKLLKLIQTINATRGINIPVAGGGQPGSNQGQGGLSGILKQFGSVFGGKKQGTANLGASEGDSGDSDGGLAGILSGDSGSGGGGLDSINFSGVAASAGVGAGIGSAIAGVTGGNQTVSTLGGGITGAGLSLIAVNPIIGGVVAGVGAIITIIGSLLGNTAKQAANIAKEIANFTQTTVSAVSASDETLVQGLQTLQGQREQAVQQLSAKGTKGNEDLAQLLPQIDQEIEQLKGQAQQIQQSFAAAFETSTLPQAIQSYGDQIQSLNKQVQDYVNAGGSAAVATQYLVNQLNQMKVAIGNSLLQSEQQAISLLQQEIQLQVQKGQIIQQEAQQESDILNQGVESRQRSQAQLQAQQILQLREQRDQQLTSINQQIAQTQAQLGDQQQIFGLTLNQNSLLQTQLAIQQQITAQTDQQITNLQALQAYLPTSPTGVSATGAPQINVPTSTLTPGQSQGALPGTVPINSAAFLKVLLGTGDYGIKVLKNLFGSVPQTLTSDQMQQVITALQTGNQEGRNLLPQLTAALTAAQNQQYAFNPGLASSLAPIPTTVTSAQAGTSGGISLGNGIVIPTSALAGLTSASSGAAATSSSLTGAAPTVQIASADSVTIGTGSSALNLSDLTDAATTTSSAASTLQTAGTTLSQGASDIVKAFQGTPASTTVSTPTTGAVSPTSSLAGTTVPLINQAQLAALEPNVPSAQAGLPPPVLGINEVTDASQLAAAQFTAPFLPIVQAVGNLISVGSAAALAASKPVATPIPAKFNSGAESFSGQLPSVTVNIQGTTNMNKADLQKAVTDGMLSAYDSFRARRGTSAGNGTA